MNPWLRSGFSVLSLVLGGACLGIAASTHEWYLGVVPLALALLAVRRNEELRVAALLGTVMMLVAGAALAAVS
jgi:hypothetical protein